MAIARSGGHGGARRGAAFSLVELVVVAAVVAIAAGIAMPRYGAAVTRYRLDAAARRVAADLDRARTAARVANEERVVEFKPLELAYAVSGEESLTKSSQEYLVRLADEPYHVHAMTVSFGGSPEVTFTAMGVPTSNGEVKIRIGTMQKRIVVNAGRSKADIY